MWKAGVTAALASIAMTQAQAQAPQCAPRAGVIEWLADDYAESRHVMAMGANGIVEMFGNVETGTLTLTITRPDGLTCIVASGGNFELLSEQPQGTVY
jgi:hypothetical protein